MDITFFVWLIVAIIQIALFSFYLGKINGFSNKEEYVKTVDIIPVCNYNGYTYWLEESSLYRENTKSATLDKKNAEKIDQISSKDLSPAEVIYILQLIEEAK